MRCHCTLGHWAGIWVLGMVISLAVPPRSEADVYMRVDKNGVFHFTNVPTTSDYRLFVRDTPPPVKAPDRGTKYDRMITYASKTHGVSFPLLKAMIKVESDFNPRAVSRAGALGLMQIMPANVRALNINDPFDPWENILGGTRYFRSLLDRYEDQVPLALAAYNAGPSAVDRHKRIPPIKETKDFVRRVMLYYQRFKEG